VLKISRLLFQNVERTSWSFSILCTERLELFTGTTCNDPKERLEQIAIA